VLYRLIAFALALIAMPLAALDAQTSDPKMQLLFIGASPEEGAPDGLPDVITHPLLRGLLISESMREWIEIPLNG